MRKQVPLNGLLYDVRRKYSVSPTLARNHKPHPGR